MNSIIAYAFPPIEYYLDAKLGLLGLCVYPRCLLTDVTIDAYTDGVGT
jgi:hypothetical protein